MPNDLLPDLDVAREISPNDIMYKTSPDYYFTLGQQALDAIEWVRRLVGLEMVSMILDLPSGHGRVLRYLRAAFPEATIDACDIDADAVDFCARTFGARPIRSTVELSAVPLAESYDLIWCGSLLTHLHADQWRNLLTLFANHLAISGLLVFTTSGRHIAGRFRSKQTTLGLSDWSAATILSDFDHFGFGFQHHPGRDGYGISLSSPSWVCAQIAENARFRLASYQERGWGGNQDVVACVPIGEDVSRG
jgi:SAM-dependent methyltransferase